MVLRTACAIATLLIGLGAQAFGGPESPPGQPQDYGPLGYYGLRGAIPPGPPASTKQDAIRDQAMRSLLRVRPGQMGSGIARPPSGRSARRYHHARAHLNAAIHDPSRPYW
jgi:hypothetical protein